MTTITDAWLDRMVAGSVRRGETDDFRTGRIRGKMFPNEPEEDADRFFAILFGIHLIRNEQEAKRGWRFQTAIEEETQTRVRPGNGE